MGDRLKTLREELGRINAEILQSRARRVLDPIDQRLARDTRKLEIEREIAAINGGEHAEEIRLDIVPGFEWYQFVGFDMAPVLFCDLAKPSPKGQTVSFTFDGCVESRFGGLNDEVFDAHPLFGKGLDVAGFYLIKNSTWPEQLRVAFATHSGFDSQWWDEIKHFLFRDKGGEFACLAKSFSLNYHSKSVADIRKTVFQLNDQDG